MTILAVPRNPRRIVSFIARLVAIPAVPRNPRIVSFIAKEQMSISRVPRHTRIVSFITKLVISRLPRLVSFVTKLVTFTIFSRAVDRPRDLKCCFFDGFLKMKPFLALTKSLKIFTSHWTWWLNRFKNMFASFIISEWLLVLGGFALGWNKNSSNSSSRQSSSICRSMMVFLNCSSVVVDSTRPHAPVFD